QVLSFDPNNDDTFVAADRITLRSGSSVNDVFVNTLTANAGSTIRGTTGPVSLPLLVLPPLPPEVNDPCTLSAPGVTVASGTTTTLDPGCYGQLRVFDNGRVEFNPGVYEFLRWRIENGAEAVGLAGHVTINIRNGLATESSTFIGPDSFDPADFDIFLGGLSANFGPNGEFVGHVFAPNANDLHFWHNSSFSGGAVGDIVTVRAGGKPGPPPPPPQPLAAPARQRPRRRPRRPRSRPRLRHRVLHRRRPRPRFPHPPQPRWRRQHPRRSRRRPRPQIQHPRPRRLRHLPRLRH